MKSKIIIITGDPNSINSEIIYKSWKKIDKNIKKKIYFISNYNLLKKQFIKLRYSTKITQVDNIYDKTHSKDLKIINLNLKFNSLFNVKKRDASKFIINALNLGHKIALRKDVLGLINCPINKKLLPKKKIGVTEYLASKCSVKDNSEVMIIKSRKQCVSPITTHIDIKDVSKKISEKLILAKIKTIEIWFKKIFQKKPKICILGLNPHNAEFEKNSEENKIIIPAIKKLNKLKIKVKGPFAADTVFIKDYKNYDIIVGMYHDQVLTPFKSLFNFDAINLTFGLKYLRASPDHGIATDLIGKNKADATSLIKCINFINKFGK